MGHLGYVLPDAEYQASPTITGRMEPAVIIPAAATYAEAENLKAAHKVSLGNYELELVVNSLLKEQMLQAIDDAYLAELKHSRYGYATVTARDQYRHLYTHYRQLRPADLIANRESLSAPFDFSAGLEPLWERIAEAQFIAEQGQQPIPTVRSLPAPWLSLLLPAFIPMMSTPGATNSMILLLALQLLCSRRT